MSQDRVLYNPKNVDEGTAIQSSNSLDTAGYITTCIIFNFRLVDGYCGINDSGHELYKG